MFIKGNVDHTEIIFVVLLYGVSNPALRFTLLFVANVVIIATQVVLTESIIQGAPT